MKTRRTGRRTDIIAPIVAALAVGTLIGWMLHAYGPPHPKEALAVAPTNSTIQKDFPSAETPVIVTSAPAMITPVPEPGSAVDVLRKRRLRLPLDGVDIKLWKGSFSERRSGGGGHAHEAVDMLAPRQTPVRAVEDGTIAKLFDSKAGGHTIYQFDSTGRFEYYYAHLDHYAEGVRDGLKVSAGDVIGYVGTSGNAPPNTPHLHFAIFELGQDKRWWEGEPIDPYLIFGQ